MGHDEIDRAPDQLAEGWVTDPRVLKTIFLGKLFSYGDEVIMHNVERAGFSPKEEGKIVSVGIPDGELSVGYLDSGVPTVACIVEHSYYTTGWVLTLNQIKAWRPLRREKKPV